MTDDRRRTAAAGALFCAALAIAPALRAERPWPVALQSAVAEEARGFEGEINLYVEDLATGLRYTHNAATPAYLASGIKLLVLVAVFEALHEGSLRWDEEVVYTEADVCDGAPRLKGAKPGDRFSVEALVPMMMQHSDNIATDLLIKRVGRDRVQRVARRYGGAGFGELTSMQEVRRAIYRRLDPRADKLSAKQIAALKKSRALSARVKQFSQTIKARRPHTLGQLEGAYQAYYDTGVNSAPLAEVGQLLAALERREVVGPVASQQMLEIMLGCQTGKKRLRAGLPVDVLLAHKTGTQHRRMCDLGLVYPADNRAIVLAVCLKDYTSSRRAEALMARLAARAYALIVRKETWPPPPPG